MWQRTELTTTEINPIKRETFAKVENGPRDLTDRSCAMAPRIGRGNSTNAHNGSSEPVTSWIYRKRSKKKKRSDRERRKRGVETTTAKTPEGMMDVANRVR